MGCELDLIGGVLWDTIAAMLLMAYFLLAVGVAFFIAAWINFLRSHHILTHYV